MIWSRPTSPLGGILLLEEMRLKKYIPYIITVLAAILLGMHLQRTQEFLFYFREQLMVFYNDADIITARYLGVSGPALLLSHWLTQFFILNYTGPVITACLGALSMLLFWKSFSEKNRTLVILPLFALPIVFQCDALFDVYYDYQGFVAFFLFALFAFLYKVIADLTDNDDYRTYIAGALSLLLFYIAGAVGALLSVYLFVVDLVERPRQSWRMLLPIVIILIAGHFCVTKAYLPLYRYAFLNSAYYEPIIEPSNFFHTSWIIVILLPFFAPLLQSLDAKIKPMLNTLITIVVLCVVSGYAYASAEMNKQKMYPMMAMDHYIVKHDWKGLLNSPYCGSSNFIMMNRVNLALSKEGKLLDNFYNYQQLAPYSLVTNLENLSLDVEITSTICELYYQMDNIATADERAFNSYEGLRYGSPSNLQMLVKTSLIFGRYQQAEKYIKMLEQTTFYADWATSQRKYLYNDEAVEADPEYGSKRQSLPLGTREFVQARGPYADLLLTIRTNPKAVAARDYAIGYLLLANDVPHINSFAEEFYGTDVMPATPLRLQEAIIAANEKDLDFCRQHGVEEKTINEYQKLKQTLIQARNSGMDPQIALQQWRNSYWYFLLVTSPRMAQIKEQMMKQQQQEEASKPQIGAHG